MDDELAQWKHRLRTRGYGPAYSTHDALRLVASVEQVRRERDAAEAVIRRRDDGWVWVIGSTPHDGTWFSSLGHDDPEPMSPAEVEAIHRARATTETSDG